MSSTAAIVLGLSALVFLGMIGWLLWRVEQSGHTSRREDGTATSFAFVGGDGSTCSGGESGSGGFGGSDGGGGGA